MTDKVEAFFDALDRVADEKKPQRFLALGTVDPAYVAGTQKAKVTFDGEISPSTKAYPRTVTVAAGNRVTLIRFGSTWVITGVVQ